MTLRRRENDAALPDNIYIGLMRLLFSALPQVASVTSGTVIGAFAIAYKNSSDTSWAIAISSVAMMIVRLSILILFSRRSDKSLSVDQAKAWEFAYLAGSIAMACVIASMGIVAVLGEHDTGTQLLCLGLALATCGGQCSIRISCRPWIPITTGTIVLGAFSGVCLSAPDNMHRIVGALLILYWLSFIEACRQSGRTIVALRLSEQKITEAARTDDLTGLMNRRAFRDTYDFYTQHKPKSANYVLVALDLDGFKQVNDSHGHPVGDELLKLVAYRLHGCLGRTGALARLGGDEFSILMHECNTIDRVVNLAEGLIKSVSEPYEISGLTIRIGVSVGIAHSGSSCRFEDLASLADQALYQAKRGGRGRYEVREWTHEMAALAA
jgi:diguanylate cyclase (GGDEF)-like protein